MEAPNIKFSRKNEYFSKIFHNFRIKYPEVFIKSVFAKNEAVVAHIHDEGFFSEIVAFEVLDNAAYAFIDAKQSFTITTVKGIKVPGG